MRFGWVLHFGVDDGRVVFAFSIILHAQRSHCLLLVLRSYRRCCFGWVPHCSVVCGCCGNTCHYCLEYFFCLSQKVVHASNSNKSDEQQPSPSEILGSTPSTHADPDESYIPSSDNSTPGARGSSHEGSNPSDGDSTKNATGSMDFHQGDSDQWLPPNQSLLTLREPTT
jgi:hypothetical protein